MTAPEVEAIVFDVFGTVVDWRSGVINAGEDISAPRNHSIAWGEIADAWREAYQPELDRVRRGELPWQNLDQLHRRSLDRILERFDLTELSEDDRFKLVHSWHRLDPWPDVLPGLHRLKSDFVIAPLSNGHIRLLTNMAKRAGIPWDLIISAELSHQYKPDEAVYLTAVELLDLAPHDVLMVAAHEGDLNAAGDAGLHTAYVDRPDEWGPRDTGSTDMPSPSRYDIVTDDFESLADRLGSDPLIE